MDSNTENVSGAQTNAERSRPRALPEALEAFVCTFQKLWRLLSRKPRDKLVVRSIVLPK